MTSSNVVMTWAGSTQFLAIAYLPLALPSSFGADLGEGEMAGAGSGTLLCWGQRGFSSAFQGGGSCLTFSADLFLHYLPF